MIEPIMVPMLQRSIVVVSQYLVFWMTRAQSRPAWQPNTIPLTEGQPADLMALPNWDFARTKWDPQGHAVNSNADAAAKTVSTLCNDRGNVTSMSTAIVGQCFTVTGSAARPVQVGVTAQVASAVKSGLTADGSADVSIGIGTLNEVFKLWAALDATIIMIDWLYQKSQQTQHVVPDPDPINERYTLDSAIGPLDPNVIYVVFALATTKGSSSAAGWFELNTRIAFSRLTLAT